MKGRGYIAWGSEKQGGKGAVAGNREGGGYSLQCLGAALTVDKVLLQFQVCGSW